MLTAARTDNAITAVIGFDMLSRRRPHGAGLTSSRFDQQETRAGRSLDRCVCESRRQQAELPRLQCRRYAVATDSDRSRDSGQHTQPRRAGSHLSRGFSFDELRAEQRVVYKPAHGKPFLPRHRRMNELRFEIAEIDARERLLDVQLTRLTVESDAIPIVDAERRVRILLNLEDHQAGTNGVDAAARQEHRISRLHRDSMKTVRNGPARDGTFEGISRHARSQADKQLRAGIGGRDVPHLRLGIAEMLEICWRVHLQRQLVAGVEDLAQQREPPTDSRRRVSEHLAPVLLHEPAQGGAGKRTVDDNALVAWPVSDLP